MDVTDDIFEFCEIRRHLWNTYFSRRINSIADSRIEDFLQIQKLLFKSIVLEKCGEGAYDLISFGSQAIEFLNIKISKNIDQLGVFVSPSRHPSQWEDRFVRREEWAQRSLLFIEFFDWYPQDPSGRCSYPFLEVEARTSLNLESAERWLVPNEYATVHYVHL